MEAFIVGLKIGISGRLGEIDQILHLRFLGTCQQPIQSPLQCQFRRNRALGLYSKCSLQSLEKKYLISTLFQNSEKQGSLRELHNLCQKGQPQLQWRGHRVLPKCCSHALCFPQKGGFLFYPNFVQKETLPCALWPQSFISQLRKIRLSWSQLKGRA